MVIYADNFAECYLQKFEKSALVSFLNYARILLIPLLHEMNWYVIKSDKNELNTPLYSMTNIFQTIKVIHKYSFQGYRSADQILYKSLKTVLSLNRVSLKDKEKNVHILAKKNVFY